MNTLVLILILLQSPPPAYGSSIPAMPPPQPIIVGFTNTVSVGLSWTNRVTNDLSLISTQPITTPCPECGGVNHHERQIHLMSAHDEYFVHVVARSGRTNTVLLDCGPTNQFIVTNLVLRSSLSYLAPPPLPGQRSMPSVLPHR